MENNLNVEIMERDPKSFAFHPSNPRDHSDESVARLAESIQEDPLYFRGRPILLSDRTGELVIIGGEGRCRALGFQRICAYKTISDHCNYNEYEQTTK